MYDKRLRKEFKKIDKDGGGFVDISELSAYILKKYKHRFRLGKFKVPASENFEIPQTTLLGRSRSRPSKFLKN